MVWECTGKSQALYKDMSIATGLVEVTVNYIYENYCTLNINVFGVGSVNKNFWVGNIYYTENDLYNISVKLITLFYGTTLRAVQIDICQELKTSVCPIPTIQGIST